MGLISGLYRGCGCTGLIALGLLLAGGQVLYTALTNPKPVEMTCAEYLEKKPTGKWLKLKDCELDNFSAIMLTRSGKVSYDEVFIPIRPVGVPEGTKVHILLASKKPEDLEFAKQGDAVDTNDKGKMLSFALANKAKLAEHRDIEGVIRHGLEDNEEDRRMFRKASMVLATDVVILDEGARPDAMKGVNLLAGGVAFVVLRFILVSYREKKAAKAAAARAGSSSGPPPLPPHLPG